MRYLPFEDLDRYGQVRTQHVQWHETLDSWQHDANSWFVAQYDPQPIVLPNGVRFFAVCPEQRTTATETMFDVVWHVYSPDPEEYAALHGVALSVSTTFAMLDVDLADFERHELAVYLSRDRRD